MPQMSDQQIRAMVSLLEDPDQRNADLVKRSLVGWGEDAIPSIVQAMKIAPGDQRNRLESILGEIRFQQLEADVARWAQDPGEDADLEAGAFLVARIGYPDTRASDYRRKLDEMARAIGPSVASLKNPASILSTINDYLFEREGFRGNIENYYDPDNSFLNRVLDRKIGIPITLSIVYLLIGRRLDLPVAGIGLPGHFIVKYETPDYIAYLDPFHQGQMLTRTDCMRFLTHSGYTADDAFLSPVSDREIVLRMIRNLAYNYKHAGAEPLVDRLRRIARAMNADI